MVKVRKSGEFDKKKVTDLKGAKDVEKEVLLGQPEGVESFAMRRFTLDSHGQTPYHSHEWEHEVYVLNGKGKIKTKNGEKAISGGDVAYVPSGEIHQFVSESEGLRFLCLVPKRGEPTISDS